MRKYQYLYNKLYSSAVVDKGCLFLLIFRILAAGKSTPSNRRRLDVETIENTNRNDVELDRRRNSPFIVERKLE